MAADSWSPAADEAPTLDITMSVGWATFFRRPFPRRLRYPRLRYAYRAPAHLLEILVTNGARLSSLRFDEQFSSATAEPEMTDVDLLYVCCHGGQGAQGFEVALTDDDWHLAASVLGYGGPKVVVFDTCDLADRRHPDWQSFWQDAPLGPDLRVVLGFESQATVSPESSLRAAAFARLIVAGTPLGPAWLQAVTATAWPGLDRPMVIGLGDGDADAAWAATEYSLRSQIGPRTGGPGCSVHVLPEAPT